MLIGFVGKKQSGKDTAANFMARQYGFFIVPFAETLKDVCKTVFGLTHEEMNDTALKEKVLTRYPYQSPREIMQKVGTEAMRNVWPDVWVEAWERKVRKLLEQDRDIVCPDVRFMNEAKVFNGLGGKLIRIVRPNLVSTDLHLSEMEQESIVCNQEITNNGTIEECYKNVTSTLLSIL